MNSSRKELWITFLSLNGILVFTFLFFPIYYKYLMNLPMNKCYMVVLLHMYCPACGGTRAFKALCEMDIMTSLKCNPIVPSGAVLFAICEFVMIKNLLLKKDNGLDIKPWMIYAVLIFWIIFYITRNIMLLFGIDALGDLIH